MLGLCCHWLEKNNKNEYKNILDCKSLQLGSFKSGKYTREHILNLYESNIDKHINIIPKFIENKIKNFRITSSLFPLWDLNKNIIINNEVILNKLKILGSMFTKNNIRVTCHPGQFVVISSDSENVIKNSIIELEYHAWIFDMMGLSETPYNCINIHGGKSNRENTLISVINNLPNSIKNRLTLENDEKCYNTEQLLNINSKTNIPIVFDSHHFTFNNDMKFEECFFETQKTWGNIKPLQHISNTEPGFENESFNKKRSHSNYIEYIPDLQFEYLKNDLIDVDVEAKQKNLAIFQIRNNFNI